MVLSVGVLLGLGFDLFSKMTGLWFSLLSLRGLKALFWSCIFILSPSSKSYGNNYSLCPKAITILSILVYSFNLATFLFWIIVSPLSLVLIHTYSVIFFYFQFYPNNLIILIIILRAMSCCNLLRIVAVDIFINSLIFLMWHT